MATRKISNRYLLTILLVSQLFLLKPVQALAQFSFLPKVDVFFIVDLSGSFADDLPKFKAAAPQIVSALNGAGLDVNFGLARFEDYPISPFGFPVGDKAYERVLDISSPTRDANSNGIADILESINGLFTRSGGDGPQSQLPSLFQAATGTGQNLSSLGFPAASIPANQQANFRSGALPIIVLWTDAAFHRPGDPGAIPYPGPSFQDTINALNSRGIKVIGIGVNAFGNTLADLATIATGTSTFAPQGGVDCNGNGTVDLLEGQPLVCPISATGTGIGQAIINAVKAATIPAQIAATRLGFPGLGNPSGFTQDPVNTVTGNYVFSRVDLAVPGRGLPLIFQRTYNSQDSFEGLFGIGWTHSFNILLTENADGSVVLKWGDGHLDFFDLAPTGGYSPRFGGVFDILEKIAGGTFRLIKKNQVVYSFNTSGKIISIVDRNSNALSFSYDASGNLTRITDTVARIITFTYDGSSRLRLLTDPIGRTVAYTYDGNGNLASVTDPNGGVMSFSYDANRLLTEIRDERETLIVVNNYDGARRVGAQTNGRGFTTTLSYDSPNPGDTTITDPRGNSTVHTHDTLFRLVGITDAGAGVTSFTYDANNNRTSITDQNGNTTFFIYNGNGNVLSITDPLGNAIAFTYDSQNNLTGATNARGFTTIFNYDAAGNLKTIQSAIANTTAFDFDGFGQLTHKTDARGNRTQYGYDGQGNLTRITDALGGITNLGYDGIGRLLSLSDPNGRIANSSYDLNSRLTQIVDPLKNATRFAYDPIGNLSEITDAKGNKTRYAYDEVNNLRAVTDALGHITQYTYDRNNNRTALIDANSNTTGYIFDALNRLAEISDPLGNRTTYGYDPVGNVVAVLDANEVTNTFTYDANNRLKRIDYGDSASVEYTYDNNGNRTSMVDTRGTTIYTYDSLDRLTQVSHADDSTVAYGYDAVGNRINLTYPDGRSVLYSYDALNRLSSLTDREEEITGYSYDPASNLKQIAYPNEASIFYNYDAANRLVKVENKRERRLISSFDYVLDALGNRVKMMRDGRHLTEYTYDALSQLLAVHERERRTEYTYDPVGNRLSMRRDGKITAYTYDQANRLLGADRTTFVYDANGNRIQKREGGQETEYEYDAANRLIQVVQKRAAILYQYDGDGNKIRREIRKDQKRDIFNFVNDVATALPVIVSENGSEADVNYVYGVGPISQSGKKLGGKEGQRFEFFYHFDGLGSVTNLTDNKGREREKYEYDAWGETAGSPKDSDPPNRFRFTGEELDADTGLYYLRARWYDPRTGTFISRDPFAGFPQRPASLNRFNYVRNNPLRLVDPSGLSPLDSTTAGTTPLALGLTSTPSATLLSTQEFYREMERVLLEYVLPKRKWYDVRSYLFADSPVFWNENLYYFEGMYVYGHELNYYVQGLLFRHYGWSEDAMTIAIEGWKLANFPGSWVGLNPRPGATPVPSPNTYLFAHRGYVEYEVLRQRATSR